MGVLVFVMAILPMGGVATGMHMLRAEMPGPAVGKLVSRMSDTAKILYGIYLVMTVIEIVAALAGGSRCLTPASTPSAVRAPAASAAGISVWELITTPILKL